MMWGLIPALTGVVVILCSVLSSWHCLMDELDWLCSTVQNFGIVEQPKVEQSLPPHVDVGEPWVVED
jgi:hypothetical protein